MSVAGGHGRREVPGGRVAVIAGVATSDYPHLPHLSEYAVHGQAADRALADAGLTMADVDGFAIRPLEQDRRRRQVVIPRIVMDRLKIPFQLSRDRVQRDHAIAEQILAEDMLAQPTALDHRANLLCLDRHDRRRLVPALLGVAMLMAVRSEAPGAEPGLQSLAIAIDAPAARNAATGGGRSAARQ